MRYIVTGRRADGPIAEILQLWLVEKDYELNELRWQLGGVQQVLSHLTFIEAEKLHTFLKLHEVTSTIGKSGIWGGVIAFFKTYSAFLRGAIYVYLIVWFISFCLSLYTFFANINEINLAYINIFFALTILLLVLVLNVISRQDLVVRR